MPRKAKPRFYTLWRNKWLTADAGTIDDMIEGLQSAANYLKEMRDAGIQLEGDCSDDYAYLFTEDPVVAEKFSLHEEEVEDEVEFDDMDEDEWGFTPGSNGHGAA